jgi:hypothetical protein
MSKDSDKDNYNGYWASVYKDSGEFRGVTFAEGEEMARTLLTSNYSKELRDLIKVVPVTITVKEDFNEQ